MKIKSFHHICIQTEVYQQSLDFYINLLGFELVKETAGFHTRAYNTWLKGFGIMIELQTPKKETNLHKWSKLNSGPVHICFVVEEVKAAYQFLKEKGHHDFKKKNGQEIYSVKGGLLFKVKAPEGTEIEIREDADLD
ncbi:MAG: VOC family protein [Aureispira sp.]|nr:VOC family protein [Aureispira sp.]